MPAITAQDRKNEDDFTSRTIAGKQRYFGFWRGERDDKSPIFTAYNKAIAAATEIEQIESVLKKDENLTDKGRLNKLREATGEFFTAKASFTRTAERERNKLRKRVDKAFDLDGYDTATNMQHHRLITAFSAMNAKQRANALLPHNLRENTQLARALVAENMLTSGLSADEHERVKASLLSDNDETELREIELAEKQIGAAEKAYGTATEVMAELAQFDAHEVQMLDAGAKLVETQPTADDKNLPLHKGGRLRLLTDDEETDDEDAGEAD